MSLSKAIKFGKEHRKEYGNKGSRRYKSLDMSCFWHNPKYCQCVWCRDNRLHKNKKRLEASEAAETD